MRNETVCFNFPPGNGKLRKNVLNTFFNGMQLDYVNTRVTTVEKFARYFRNFNKKFFFPVNCKVCFQLRFFFLRRSFVCSREPAKRARGGKKKIANDD